MPHAKRRGSTKRPNRPQTRAARPVSAQAQAIVRIARPANKPWDLKQEEVELVKAYLCPGATDIEFKWCMGRARHYRLDPFRQQIHFVPKRSDDTANQRKFVAIVGIDGLRHIAARDHRDYGSEDEPQFGPMITVRWRWKGQGEWKDLQVPEWAKAAAWKKGADRPTVATVYWTEIYPNIDYSPTVRQMPRLMLGKCAEAQAIRKAYPATDGLYVREEIQGRPEFTPEGRLIEYKDEAPDADVQSYTDRLTPEQRAIEQEALAKARKKVQEQQVSRQAEPMFKTEYVDPDKSKCSECGSSFGVHLMKCSKFVSPQVSRESVAPESATPKPANGGGAESGAKPDGSALTYEQIGKGVWRVEGQELGEMLVGLWGEKYRGIQKATLNAEQLGKLMGACEKQKVALHAIQNAREPGGEG